MYSALYLGILLQLSKMELPCSWPASIDGLSIDSLHCSYCYAVFVFPDVTSIHCCSVAVKHVATLYWLQGCCSSYWRCYQCFRNTRVTCCHLLALSTNRADLSYQGGDALRPTALFTDYWTWQLACMKAPCSPRASKASISWPLVHSQPS